MTANKTVQNDNNVVAFLEKLTNDAKREDSFSLLHLMQKITGDEPVMWGTSIIGFGSYHYHYESGRQGDSLRVGFSPRAQNIAIYIIPGFSELSSQLSQLGKHKIGKSCLYIKRLSDINFEVLREIIESSVKIMSIRYPNEDNSH